MFKWEQNKNWKRRFQFDILLTKIWKENQNLKEDEKQRQGKQKEKFTSQYFFGINVLLVPTYWIIFQFGP